MSATDPSADCRLTARRRIRARVDFERAYSRGVRKRGSLLTLFIVPNGGVEARLGVAATKKLGGATIRNRAKRLSREVFRRHRPTNGVDIVIVPRREMLHADSRRIEAEYLELLGSGARAGERSAARPRRPSRPGRPAGL